MIKWPLGAAGVQTPAYAATVAVAIDSNKSIVTIGQLTGACTLNITPHAEQKAGDELIVKTSADGTNRVITWGTSMSGNAYTNTASKSVIHNFVFDGTNFVLLSSNQTN